MSKSRPVLAAFVGVTASIVMLATFFYYAETHDVGKEIDDLHRLFILYTRKEVSCPQQTKDTIVLLLIGQSNSANHAEQSYGSSHGDKIINYFDGRCLIAASPLLGATGLAGESWTLLGNKIISSGLADRVVLISAGVGASAIVRWQKGGDLNTMLLNQLDKARPQFRITHVLWHQGESDYGAGTTGADYMKMFMSLVDSLRSKGVDAPIFPSVATKCFSGWHRQNAVSTAQILLADKGNKIFAGVDTDSLITDGDRYDGCHFAASGQEKFAEAWFQIIKDAR